MDHARNVLAGIIPGRRDNLLYALTHLSPEHFRHDAQRNIFVMLERYYNIAADILPRKTLSDLLRRQGVEVAKAVLYEELFDDVDRTVVQDHEFRYSVDALKQLRSEQLFGEAITKAFEIFERGVEEKGRTFKGLTDAKGYLYQELSRIDKLGNADIAPEGDMFQEASDIRSDYARRKEHKETAGIYSGIQTIDNVTAGYQNGELILIVAYTGEGKSQYVTQTAWQAAVKQGRNVFFATTETIRPTVRRRILARHSREPQFSMPGGLNSKDIKNGTLTPDQEQVLEDVIDDLTNNPTYGKLYIAQIPRGGSLAFLEARMIRQQANWNIDLVVMDYLALLRPENRWDSRVAALTDLIVEAKQIAASFDDGRGVPFISPWAMQQGAYREAQRVGEYTLASLSDTSEAEKSADQIMSILSLADQPNQVKCQFLKNRDGETPPPFALEVDFRCAYLGEKRQSAAVAGLLDDDDLGI